MGTVFVIPKGRLSKLWTTLLQQIIISLEGKFKLRFENVCVVYDVRSMYTYAYIYILLYVSDMQRLDYNLR